MRRFLVGLLMIVLLLMRGPEPTLAREIRQGDQCMIGANETIQGDLFALCRTLRVEGHVTGNVMGAATDATFSGTIDGDVYVAAGQLDVSGTLGGNLHFGGAVLRILPTAHFASDKLLTQPR